MSRTTEEQQDDVSPTDELWQVEQKTNEDGTVQGEITGWRKSDGYSSPQTIVSIRLPNGYRFEESMAWPGAADLREYKFVRVVNHCGFSLTSVDQIVDQEISCKQIDGDWQVVVPYTPTIEDKLRKGLMVVLMPAFLIKSWKRCLDEDMLVDDVMGYIIYSAILIVTWVAAVLIVYLLLGILLEIGGFIL